MRRGLVLLVAAATAWMGLAAVDTAGDSATRDGPERDESVPDARARGAEGDGPAAQNAAASTSTTSVPTTSTTSTTTPMQRRATLLFAGDVLTHMPLVRATARPGGGHDFAPMLSSVGPVIAAPDVAVCHMEVPVSPDNSVIAGYPLFSAPTETAAAMAGAGFDGCSTASNHSLDRGFGGLAGTLGALDGAGLAHAGTGRSPEEATAPAWYDAGGIIVAHLSYTFGTNGLALPPEAPWSVRLIDPDVVVADAERVRAAGAEVVVVSLHWGVEYRAEPTEEQRSVADAITRSGSVDLIVGHHAHVPQPIERVNGRWVIYGLGNFVSNQTARCCSPAAQDGVIATAEVVVSGAPGDATVEVERVVFTPIRVDREAGYLVVPVAEALLGLVPRGTMDDAELRESWARTTSVVSGTLDPRLVPSAQP